MKQDYLLKNFTNIAAYRNCSIARFFVPQGVITLTGPDSNYKIKT
jgi:hypothetical protein